MRMRTERAVNRPAEQPARFETIRFTHDGAIGTLALARPEKLNALNPQMLRELRELGEDLVGRPHMDLRCLVISGQGSSFSAGLDLTEGIAGDVARLAEGPPGEAMIDAGRAIAGTFEWIPHLSCPSVAAVHGHAYGAGLQLALACDFRIFAHGSLVGLTETRFGLLPDMGATWRLPRVVGPARAREMILLGDIIDAETALRTGLANYVVARESLETAAAELAHRIASQPPLAIAGARRAMARSYDVDDDAALAAALAEQARCLTSHDFEEALRARSENRRPEWRGH